jgi:hypothetical protein
VPPAACHTPTQHAPAGQSCITWARKAPRVPPAACHTPTCAKTAKINHVWPTACPKLSVMHNLGLESTQSASTKTPTNIEIGPEIQHL